MARPMPAPMKKPPNTAVSSKSGVTSGYSTKARHKGQPGNGQDAFDRKLAADLPVAQNDERDIENQNQHEQGNIQHIGCQHGYARHAAINEAARQQETLQPHARRQDAKHDEKAIDDLPYNLVFHTGSVVSGGPPLVRHAAKQAFFSVSERRRHLPLPRLRMRQPCRNGKHPSETAWLRAGAGLAFSKDIILKRYW